MLSAHSDLTFIPNQRKFGVALRYAILLVLYNPLFAQSLPTLLRHTLTTHLQATEKQLKSVERGGVVAYSAKTESSDEIMLVGMTRIWATPESFVRSFRDVISFESAPGITGGSKFSSPPKVSDFKGLSLSKKEIDELKACKPGDCTFKIGDAGLKTFRNSVNWNSPNYVQQANEALRHLWLQYLVRYQESGDKGLAVYHDTSDYFSVEKGLHALLDDSTALQEYTPRLREYLRSYPQSKDQSPEEFFYWQVGEFGLKPVHRVSHVVIQQSTATLGEAYVIASKMLFASHYFRSAVEFRYIIPGQDQRTGGMHYLVTVQRSQVDGMRGLRGRLLRAIAVRKARQALQMYLTRAKGKVEQDFKQRRT